MQDFIELYDKSKSSLDISDEEFVAAARNLYGILLSVVSSRGEDWPIEPRMVCHLTNFIPLPDKRDKDLSYRDYLTKAFKEKTGKEWDAEKYMLVLVPTQFVGGSHFVVFEK